MNGSKIPLDEMTLRQLRLVASEYEVSRYSRMRKVELVAAIRSAQAARAAREAAAAEPTKVVAKKAVFEAAVTDATTTTKIVAEAKTTAQAVAIQDKPLTMQELSSVDNELRDLPEEYGESRIVLMPRDSQWAYAYWDVPELSKEAMRRQGGVRLAIRFYDVTNIDINVVRPHSLQQYECDEMAREWFLPVPVSDRDYIAEIGYVTADGRWLLIARSTSIHVPAVYPSTWIEDHFVTVDWDNDLHGKTVTTLASPKQNSTAEQDPIYGEILARSQAMEAQRMAGSLFGSMHQVPDQAVSSFVFPSGVGMWALPTAASTPPIRSHQFWLVADAELIVHGTAEPDATITIGEQKIDLNPDGTFRFQLSFKDGVIDYPIKAVSADGTQTCSIHMNFTRETSEHMTETPVEGVKEWFAF